MLADRLGSIIEVVETATNTVTASAEFDSFGARTVTGTPERYGFTGREHDIENALIYYRARHYDPAAGQFLQRDPIGFAGGDLNLYTYVENDPYNWTDPSGLSSTAGCASGPACKSQGRAVAGAVGGGAVTLAQRIGQMLAGLSIAAIMSNEGGDQPDHPPPPPIGHNNPPEDPEPDGPDPSLAALLAALAAAGYEILGPGPFVGIDSIGPNGESMIAGNITINGDNVTINDTLFRGNAFDLRRVARSLAEATGASTVTVNGNSIVPGKEGPFSFTFNF